MWFPILSLPPPLLVISNSYVGHKVGSSFFNRSVHFFWWPNGLSIMILRILQALLFLLALVLRAANTPPECDSGEELITPRQQIRPRLIKSPPDPILDVPVAGTLDQHPSRNDVLNTSMREKVWSVLVEEFLWVFKFACCGVSIGSLEWCFVAAQWFW